MRAAQLPESLALGQRRASHVIITATNASESYRLFRSRDTRRHTPPTPTSTPPIFHLAHLLPQDWTALLRACRTWTEPGAAFNFSSPGDVSSTETRTSSGETAGHAEAENSAFMHIVRRYPGDFVPNNMIYHALQQFTNAGGDPAIAARNVAFNSFVRTLQSTTPPSTATEAVTDQDDDMATLETKRGLDPLATDAEARARSLNNERIQPATSSGDVNDDRAASAVVAGSAPPADTFYFHPHLVHVASSIPYRSTHFCVMVNLKPIVPRHLMVVPLRCVGTIHGLTTEETEDWGRIMAITIRALDVAARMDEKQSVEASLAAPPSEGNYSIAIQQGAAAGQTVAHLHTHVIPFDPRGKLAGEPESDEQEQQRRPPRTAAMMAEETQFFADIFLRLCGSNE